MLERDLTKPPTAEIIDDTHQKFDGVVYCMRRNKLGIAGHYDKGVPIHRAVWAYYNGEIPDGYQIHHIDENPANNGISNLQCLTVSEHRRIHNQVAPVRTFTCQFCGKIFEVRSSAIHSTNYSVKFF